MTSTGLAHRADVQGLRGIAVLGVVLYHIDRFLHGGFAGVDIFFVISGYVIAASVLRRSEASGRVSFGEFYRRRAVRILPALGVFLVGSVPFVLLGPAAVVEASTSTAVAAAGFMANMQLALVEDSGYFAVESDLNPFLHLWSLSVEEQFYLAFPILLSVGVWRARNGHSRSLRRLLWAAAATSFLLMVVVIGAGRLDAAFFLAPTRAWEFLVGALLATRSHSTRRTETAALLRLGGLTAIGITMVFAVPGQWPGLLTVVPVAGTAAVIAAGDRPGPGYRAVSHPAIVALGTLSYSWYLWHWPIVVLTRATAPGVSWLDDVLAVAALIPAWLSWHYVEEPARRSELPTLRAIGMRGGPVAVAVVLLLAVVTPALGDRLPGNSTEVADTATVAAIVALDACPSGAPTTATGPTAERCGSAGDAAQTAVLLGDSFGGQVADPFRASVHSAGWNPVVRTRTRCAFLPELVLYERGIPHVSCQDHTEEVWNYVQTERPAVVVIANRLQPALVEGTNSIGRAGAEPVSTLTDRHDLVLDAYRDLVRSLTSQGTRVVFVRGTPETEPFVLANCSRLRWLIESDGCGRTTTLAEARTRRAPADAVLDTVAAEFGLTVLDFDEELCTEDRCLTRREGAWRYVDGAHLSADFAQTLVPMFRPLFSIPDSETGDPGRSESPAPVPNGDEPHSDAPPEDVGIEPPSDNPPSTQPARPDVTIPEIPVPHVTIPEVPVPDVTIPEVPVPNVTIPEIRIPGVVRPRSTVPR